TPNSPGSAPSTTPSGSTPASATSPPRTSITAAAPVSAAPAPPACAAPARSGSSRIERASHDHHDEHRQRPPARASAGRSVPARGRRPPARTPTEPGTEAASELAPNTQQPDLSQPPALG